MALMNLIALASGLTISHIGKLLLALSCLTLIPLAGSHIASLSIKSREMEQKKIIILDAFILVVLALILMAVPESKGLMAVMSVLILVAVFLENHLMKHYQLKPHCPCPTAVMRTRRNTPHGGRGVLAFGSVGVCVFFSGLIINLKALL
jgi:uncharacterized membrane protein YfhO